MRTVVETVIALILLILVLSFVGGCTRQVTDDEVSCAEQACDIHGGASMYRFMHPKGSSQVLCKNQIIVFHESYIKRCSNNEESTPIIGVKYDSN